MSQITPLPHPSRFASLRWILLASFITLFTVILAAIFLWFYTFATRQMMNLIKEELVHSAQVTAMNIDGDQLVALYKEGQPNAAGLAWQAAANDAAALELAQTQFGAPNQAGFSDDPRYQDLLDRLEAIHNIYPRVWPYLWVNGDGTSYYYMVDLAARLDPAKSTYFLDFGDEGYITTKLELVTDAQGNLVVSSDPWGDWYTAFMPINDSRGNLIGGAGIYVVADEVAALQRAIGTSMLITFALTYLVVVAAVLWISRMITRPIVALTHATEAVGEGNYDQDFSQWYGGRFIHTEVGILAQMFAGMVGKVHQRVEKLKQQVEELRIEVDEARRQQQVDEIADTDFFRDLTNRAREMRGRRGSPSQGETDEPGH